MTQHYEIATCLDCGGVTELRVPLHGPRYQYCPRCRSGLACACAACEILAFTEALERP